MKKLVKEWLPLIIIALILTILIKRYLFFIAYVPTNSMENTIMTGERLLVTCVHAPEKLKRGDVVVFHFEEAGADLVKRLIGLPGDRIKIVDGDLFINGEKVPEPYVKDKDMGTYFDGKEVVVPDESYFFLGDNRPVSMDARYWSYPFISAEHIKGKVRMVIFPLNKIRLLDNQQA